MGPRVADDRPSVGDGEHDETDSSQRLDRRVLAALAALAYLPMLCTRPGRVSADTKSYLTIDPARLLSRAASMWDPHVGAGTVTHQNIGYLFPLGPYYWVMDRVGVPDWVAQRLLWGTLVFAAATGVWALTRRLGWTRSAGFVAALAYGFSPYLLNYLARLSVILAPWCALPWLVLLAHRAARERTWRAPAQFALVVALVGSVNATSLLYVGLGPVLWVLCDVFAGRLHWRPVAAAFARIGALTLAVSVWWIVGLRVQGAYGLDILRYTETYQTVGSASTPTEILRGLGYWFFYGSDRLGTWVGPSATYLDNPLVMTLGFTLAGLSLVGLTLRSAGRSAAAVLLLVGLGVSVGAAPLSSPSPYGNVFLRLTDRAIGMALRSTPRAAPLVVLALALGLGSLAHHAAGWQPRRRTVASVSRNAPLLLSVAVLALLWPWFTGGVLTPALLRDESLPADRAALATWLDANGTSRVYELPAANFADYRWGGTIDPVLPGMIDRPTIAREQVPLGGLGTADLLDALERRIYEGWFEPNSLAPVARVLAAGTVVVRNDLQYERYRLARPGPLWQQLTGAFGAPTWAGSTVRDAPVVPITDELTLAHRDAPAEFPSVAAFDLDPSAPTANLVDARAPIVLVGSGDGIVDAAAAGLLTDARPIVYDAVAATHPDALSAARSPWLIVTDSNRRQSMHWTSVGADHGALETAGEQPLEPDPADSRLGVLPDDDAYRTVSAFHGDVGSVRADNYGAPGTLTPEDAPVNALDGDPRTAWRGGVFRSTDGLRLRIDLTRQVSPPSITVLQPVTGATARTITSIDVVLDGSRRTRVALDERSLSAPGQVVPLPTGAFSTLELVVRTDSTGALSSYAGQPGVGFAEVTIPGVTADATVQVPRIASVTADAAANSRLTYVFTRQRIDPATPNRSDPEGLLDRTFDVPTERTLTLRGQARLSGAAPDEALLGDVAPDSSASWRATASARLPGSPASFGGAAVDGDPDTAWQTPFDTAVGSALTLTAPAATVVDHVRVAWLDDALHSRPTRLTLTAVDGPDAGFRRTIDLTSARSGDVVTVAALKGTRFALTIDAVAPLTTPNWFSGVRQQLPVGISEVALDDGRHLQLDGSLPAGCRSDLAWLDGVAVPVRVTGTVSAALQRDELAVEACGDPVTLTAGSHRLVTAKGIDTGIDLDRVVLDSSADGADTPSAQGPVDGVRTITQNDTSSELRLPATAAPTWLVFRQSWNAGWHAQLDGVDLGEPTLIDGYANGWQIPAGADGRILTVRWTPQEHVRIALWLSAAAGLVVLLVALPLPWPRLRRHRRSPAPMAVANTRSLPTRARRVLVVGGLLVMGGPAAALASLAVQVWPRRARWRAWAFVLAAGAVAGGYVVAAQFGYDYPATPDWPGHFAYVAPFAWAAVAAAVTGALCPANGEPGDHATDQPPDQLAELPATERHTSTSTAN